MTARKLTVVQATRLKLEELAGQVPGLDDHPLAATARVLATALDGKNSLTSKTMAAARMVDIFERLEARVPLAEDDDTVAQLADPH